MKNTSPVTSTSSVTKKQLAERPILFQTEMVNAILRGRKTQTRREIKNIEIKEGYINGTVNFECKKKGFYEAGTNVSTKKLNLPFVGILDLCKYGKPGNLLWVREKFTPLPFDMVNQRTGLHFSYFADCDAESLEIAKEYGFKWKPSIHMPKDAARIWLMIEDIRIERVQDISEKDARAEGVKYNQSENLLIKGYQDYLKRDLDDPNYMLAVPSFGSLWISINGEESWHANPWVWVIQFRLLSKTGRPSDEVIQQNLIYISAPTCPAGRSAVNERKEVANG